MDRLPASCVLICATNLKDLIDPAVLRRFEVVLTIPAPSGDTLLTCARKELAPGMTPGRDVSHLADVVAAHPFLNLSALVHHCKAIRRDLVLNNGNNAEHLAASATGALLRTDAALLG